MLKLLDYPSYFKLTNLPLAADKSSILERLSKEKLIKQHKANKYDITNLGAILFANNLSDFPNLDRKAVRVIFYKGNNKIETLKERTGEKGYAIGFEGLIKFLNDQLPSNEEIGQAFRKEKRVYPELAIRELVANSIIHQDLTYTGSSPMVEVFEDRIEITNPGKPLISPMRFIDEPPQSRNEMLAKFMRRVNICEERGTGIDKVIYEIERYQLPAPEFSATDNSTKVTLFGYRKVSNLTKQDKIRACFQHSVIKFLSKDFMTNSSFRERLGVDEKNYPLVSRIIKDALKEGLIKPQDPTNTSPRHNKYVPFFA